MNRQICTDFLVSTPNFKTGFGSVMNIAGNYYQFNQSKNGSESDALALFMDWASVGEDVREAIDEEVKDLKATE